MLNRELWFPTPVYYGEVDVTGCESKCMEYEKPKSEFQDNGYSDNMQKDPQFKELFDDILKESQHVFNENYDTRKGGFKILNAWVNITKAEEFHKLHVHPNADYSGCVYIKTPENCGNIFFEDPNFIAKMDMMNLNNMQRTVVNIPTVEYTPTVGKLLFFPNWLRHSVLQNHSGETRISIAFNLALDFKDKLIR
uniref:2OG-Fe(II) oxygenase n=1 Tax=Nitrosopumivirus cobalaminus TaxID=3158414 RepID=A0AAU7N486_9VIRU